MQQEANVNMEAPKKNKSTALFVIIIILLLISNAVMAFFLFMAEEDVVVENDQAFQQDVDVIPEPISEESEEMEIPELQTAQVGEPVNLGDYTLTLNRIENPIDPEEITINLAEGYKYVAIEILIENETDSSIVYSTDWTLYDGDGYDYGIYARKEPRFSQSGNIPINGSTRGWLNFRTVEDADNFTVKFNDTITGYSVEFVESIETDIETQEE